MSDIDPDVVAVREALIMDDGRGLAALDRLRRDRDRLKLTLEAQIGASRDQLERAEAGEAREAALREALMGARPFVALEAGLANSGMGKPGNGAAPKVLIQIDEALP